MLDHIGVPVRDLARSKAFYEKALAPLGYGVVMELDPSVTNGAGFVGFGRPGKPQFWITTGKPLSGVLHVAFRSLDRAGVAAFHAAALAAGATDNGGPGLRPHYHPNYYGAFVFDPDGHNVEAVCHEAED
jgi:catechol 2,3-dioxygenase-like lactoylglutathione lyase family enzyme